MVVYKNTIKATKASAVKVKFEDKEKLVEKEEVTATIRAEQKDTTITTSSTDSEIRGILPNPMRKLRKVTE